MADPQNLGGGRATRVATPSPSYSTNLVKILVDATPAGHAFNPSTQEAEAGDLSEFGAILVYKLSSRIDSVVTLRNSVLKEKKILLLYGQSLGIDLR